MSMSNFLIIEKTTFDDVVFLSPAEELGGIVYAPGRRQFGIRNDRGDRRVRRQRILDPVTAVDELQRCLRRYPKLQSKTTL
jgi:hypothetical protein